MVSPRAERLARNEATFRVANERMADWEERHGSGHRDRTEPYFCECSDIACSKMLELRLDEYEEVRSDPRRFFVIPGHADPTVEQIVRRADGYEVVEKNEEVHELVERLDPRRE